MKLGIFFEIDKSFNHYVIKKKNYLSKLFKDHYKDYTNEPTHITLFTFNIIKSDFDNLKKRLKKNKKEFSYNVKVLDYGIFYNDPSLNNLNTLHILIKKNNKLSKIQIYYLKLISNLIIKKNYNKFPKLYSYNINKYKYPFIGVHWKPHLTISAFNNNDTKVVRELLKIKINKTLKLSRLSLYEIKNKKSYKIMSI